MRRIVLVGYMGSGKTTVGKALSKETGMMFYDLDWYIENRMHTTVSKLFTERGEEAFRKIEYNMLHEVAEFEDVIISCGGGTPCFFDNMDYLNQQGDVVYLKASPDTLYKHLLMAKVERPLLKGKSPEELIAYITEHYGPLTTPRSCTTSTAGEPVISVSMTKATSMSPLVKMVHR